VTIKFTKWDVVDYLVDSNTMALYLSACLEEGGVTLFLHACGDVARAKGMTDVAADAGLTRASLYKALDEGGNPTMKTVALVLESLGFKMVIKPIRRSAKVGAASVVGRARADRAEAPPVRTRLAQEQTPYVTRKAPAKKAKGRAAPTSKRQR
jgi:probable addiction module antidote protein